MTVLPTLLVAARDRQRLQTILQTLGSYGLGSVLTSIGLANLVKALPFKKNVKKTLDLTEPQRLRLVLESLGPTYIKLGQILAARGDLLPPEWTLELSNLHSSVPALPWETIKPLLEAELGLPLEEVFAQIEPLALAAGSIAQVHKAKLHNGELVAVKIQRPGAEATVRADMRIFSALNTTLESQWQGFSRYRVGDILEYLSNELQSEFDFTQEARRGDAARQALTTPGVIIPKIHWDFTTRKLLIQQFVNGISPTDQTAIENLNLDRDLLAKRGADSFLDMILAQDFFHADLHPGNVRLLTGNELAYLDFGMTGSLTHKRRNELVDIIAALFTRNTAAFTTILRRWQDTSSSHDQQKLETTAHAFVVKQSADGGDASVLVQNFLSLMRSNHILVPPDLAVALKAIVTAEGTLRSLNPQFNLIAAAESKARSTLRKRFSPKIWRGRSRDWLLQLDHYADEVPLLAETLLDWAKTRKSAEKNHTEAVHALSRAITLLAKMVAAGLVLGAILIALALLLTAP